MLVQQTWVPRIHYCCRVESITFQEPGGSLIEGNETISGFPVRVLLVPGGDDRTRASSFLNRFFQAMRRNVLLTPSYVISLLAPSFSFDVQTDEELALKNAVLFPQEVDFPEISPSFFRTKSNEHKENVVSIS